jgi:hypothetical protein
MLVNSNNENNTTMADQEELDDNDNRGTHLSGKGGELQVAS